MEFIIHNGTQTLKNCKCKSSVAKNPEGVLTGQVGIRVILVRGGILSEDQVVGKPFLKTPH